MPPTSQPWEAPAERRSCLPRAHGPGDLRCSELGSWLPVEPVEPGELLTARRNTTIIILDNITHPHMRTSRPPCAQLAILTAAQPHGLYGRSECCKPALRPVIHITLPPIAVPQQQALVGLRPSQSILAHATARRHPRFSLLAACCEETLAISRMHNIFRICPATDWARLLHSSDTAPVHSQSLSTRI